jgi:hypothetical protein
MAQAPVLNKLYTMANQDPTLKDRLKFMGVGKDNDEMAMKMWKAFHKVPFPMIADPGGMHGGGSGQQHMMGRGMMHNMGMMDQAPKSKQEQEHKH